MSDPIVEARPDRDTLVRSWLRVIAATVYVPRSSTEVTAVLTDMVDALVAALSAEPFDSAAGEDVGARMVAEGFAGTDTLRRSAATLSAALLARGADPASLVSLFAAMASGYADAWRERTLAQQENMRLALHAAMRRAERDRKAAETVFREVFTSAAVGIAITDTDGRFVEVNPALAAILARDPADLAGHSLDDFLSDEPDEPGSPLAHLPDRQRLAKGNGETAWVYAKSSELTDESGLPTYHVTMVQDLSETHLLGDRLTHQLLHDALTGVANRVSFGSKLEAVHGRVAPTDTLTLCCLDLDAFAMVNTTHGHPVGDLVLRTVADRLGAVVAEETAVVARLGGDEFAILIQDGPDTPSVPELVEAIQTELAEPDYRDGVGMALGVTIGVARSSQERMDSAELFRAADTALRQARALGRRQWAEYDPDADKRDRAIGKAALELPSAWENGELEVAYDRVVRLADDVPVRVSAIPHRPRPRSMGALPSTAELAESTGLAVAIGPWLVRRAIDQVPVWQVLFAGVAAGGPAARVLLSASQSADAELAGTLNRAIAEVGVAPSLLEFGLATATVLTSGDAQDNLRTLGDIGVVPALHGFGGGPRELAMIERFRVRTVLLADPFDGWRPDWLPRDCAQVRAARELIAAITDSGAEVGVRGVRDHAEASWWADLGVTTGEGAAFGLALDVEDVLKVGK